MNCDAAEKRHDTIKRLDTLLEYAVIHGDESVVERTREEDLVKK